MFGSPYLEKYRVSSPYGMRTHPGTGKRTKHHGVDLVGEHKTIYACASGTVVRSYLSTSYGHCIIIRHKIDGKTYETLYAHLSRRYAIEGQWVSRGGRIGIEGNTGHSFGSHLHLEIHRGTWNPNKSNAVDPMIYLNRPKRERIAEDGIIGYETVRALQSYLNTPADGVISKQKRNHQTTKGHIYKVVTYDSGGSQMVRALQRVIGVRSDGYLGPQTVVALSKFLKIETQYTFNYPLVLALQRYLNKQG